MDITTIKPIVEALIFVSEEPLTENTLLLALSDSGVDREMLRACVESIQKDFIETPERGICLVEVAGGYQFRTKETHAEWIKKLNVPRPVRLSSPALETLAIVAYKQPIVRSEVEKIRGVDSGAVLKTLLEKRFLRIVGRRDEPGQPLLYGTTKEFLETFSLKNLKELPTLRDVEELLRERREGKSVPQNLNPLEPGVDGEGVSNSENVVSGEGDNPIEAIHRYALDENVEEEKKDMEALTDLEDNLKDLRKLEKHIFPKPIPGLEGFGEGDENGSESSVQGEAAAGGWQDASVVSEEPFGAVEDSSREDAPATDDGASD